jgi:hypothetical protein
MNDEGLMTKEGLRKDEGTTNDQEPPFWLLGRPSDLEILGKRRPWKAGAEGRSRPNPPQAA